MHMERSESTREAVGRALVEFGRYTPDLVVLGGDLNKSTFTNLFGAEFPDRFFDFGPAEQNMVSAAAGMAASGKTAIVSTFAVFATSRPHDQLRVGVSQANLNVKVIATHAGIITGEDGVSAHAVEDIAIMSALSAFKVVVPSDAVEAVEAVKHAINHPGPYYVRLSRPATPVLHGDAYKFAFGKAETLREGSDVTLVACGIMVKTALDAAADLASEGIECQVLNMHTVKPLDQETLIQSARKTGAVVTAEEHYLSGGLGRLVAQALGSGHPTPLEMVGLEGYTESGQPDELLDKYRLAKGDVNAAVKRAIGRKFG